MHKQKNDWKTLILTLFGGFREDATDAAIDAYVIALMDIPFAFVKQAVIKSIREDKWLPKASQLRAHALSLMPRKRNPYVEAILKRGHRARPPLIGYTKQMQDTPKPHERLTEAEMNRRRTKVLEVIARADEAPNRESS